MEGKSGLKFKKKPVFLYFLYTDWEIDQRRYLIKEMIKSTSYWANAVLIQQPVSILVHIFARFRGKFIPFLKGKYNLRKSAEGNYVFTPKIFFHQYLWAKYKWTSMIDLRLYNLQYKRFIKKHFPDRYIILWIFHNRLYPLLEKIKHNYVVYDYQDNYDYLSDGTLSQLDFQLNQKLIIKSDFILCTAKAMYDRAIKLNNSCVYMTNANDFKTLNEAKLNLHIDKRIEKKQPIIGFFGNIRDWFDFQLLNKLINEFPEVEFQFIGKLASQSKKEFERLEKACTNIVRIPFLEQSEAVPFLVNFDVGIIPFKVNKVMEGVFPNKFFEYLALGIPVVTTALPELEKYKDIIGYAKNQEEFVSYCRKAMEGKFGKFKEDYLKLAKENTWEKNAEALNSMLYGRIMNIEES